MSDQQQRVTDEDVNLITDLCDVKTQTTRICNHLYGLESAESILLIQCGRVLQERGGLTEVHDGDGDVDGAFQTVCLQVDVLLAVRPQQVWSQQSEPAGRGRAAAFRSNLCCYYYY